MRSRFVGLLLAAILIGFAPCGAGAQTVDSQKIKNLRSQQTAIENRIADLQSQVDDASAEKTYCSAQERDQDLKKLRALQRQIIELRNQYADFKAGFTKLAATPTAGPQFDAEGIHPDERSYWTADDNALRKLSESYRVKADRVEKAPIIDCNAKKTTPTPAPATETPPAKKSEEQPSTIKPPAKGPTAPLGGPQPGTGCTEKERHDRILRIQDEILRLEAELIPIDGTTPEGRGRQLQLRREIDRLAELMKRDCPPLLDGSQAPSPKQAVEPPKGPTMPLGGTGNILIPLDPFEQLEDDAEDALDELDEAMGRCDEDWVKELIPDLERLARQAHDAADLARAAGKLSRIDWREAQAMAEDLDEAIDDAKKFKCPVRLRKVLPRGFPMRVSPFDQRIIAIHNEERALVGVPPLEWSYKLEWDSMAYASHLAETRQLVHAPREGRGIERENLLQARIGWSPDRMMQSWTNEKSNFRAGLFPDVAIDGNWLNVAHYTQMIWPTTFYVGCGYAQGGGFGWLVCRYSPGGNKDGKPVGTPQAAADAVNSFIRPRLIGGDYGNLRVFPAGPLLFEKVYSPVLRANRPANPDGLENGDDAVYYWGVFEYARDFGHWEWAFATLDKLKFYAQTAREHSIEERAKGNAGASAQYAAMAKQVDQRVAAGEAEMKKKGYQRPQSQHRLERG